MVVEHHCVSVVMLLAICLCLDAVHLNQKMCVATLPDIIDVLGGLQYNAFVSGSGACLASPLLGERHYTVVHWMHQQPGSLCKSAQRHLYGPADLLVTKSCL